MSPCNSSRGIFPPFMDYPVRPFGAFKKKPATYKLSKTGKNYIYENVQELRRIPSAQIGHNFLKPVDSSLPVFLPLHGSLLSVALHSALWLQVAKDALAKW